MSGRLLDAHGTVCLEWDRHRYELTGEGDTLVLRSPTGPGSLAVLGWWMMRRAPGPAGGLRSLLDRHGLKVRVRFR